MDITDTSVLLAMVDDRLRQLRASVRILATYQRTDGGRYALARTESALAAVTCLRERLVS